MSAFVAEPGAEVDTAQFTVMRGYIFSSVSYLHVYLSSWPDSKRNTVDLWTWVWSSELKTKCLKQNSGGFTQTQVLYCISVTVFKARDRVYWRNVIFWTWKSTTWPPVPDVAPTELGGSSSRRAAWVPKSQLSIVTRFLRCWYAAAYWECINPKPRSFR